MNRYKKGRRYEYLTKKELEENGYMVIRSAGSHSPYDLVAFHPIWKEIRFIQVKFDKKKYEEIITEDVYHNCIVCFQKWIYGKTKKRKNS